MSFYLQDVVVEADSIKMEKIGEGNGRAYFVHEGKSESVIYIQVPDTNLGVGYPFRMKNDIAGLLVDEMGASSLKNLEGREFFCFTKNREVVDAISPARYDTNEDFEEAA